MIINSRVSKGRIKGSTEAARQKKSRNDSDTPMTYLASATKAFRNIDEKITGMHLE